MSDSGLEQAREAHKREEKKMNNRWKMNRIGFVNFWLYDEEDFEFEDGKLL